MYENRNKETYTKPFDIKCGFAVLSSHGRHIVFPTEEEAYEYLKEKEKEKEMVLN